MDKAKKDLVIPKSLGNFVTEGGSGGGITPEEAAEIASAVTEEALYEYNIELEVELEEIRDAISGNTDTLLDLAEIAAMDVSERVALFDEVYEKASNGEKIYIKGLVQEETIRTAILPLVSYRPETNPVLHQGGNLYFAAKGDTDNVYFHFNLYSDGSVDPVSGQFIKRNIYNLPTASAEVKGGVRIGSGLTMTQDTLSLDTTGIVTDGDLAPFIVQQSANTENIATLSAATEAISESLGNYATTADTNELATAISGVSESLANYATTATTDALSAVTSGLAADISTLSGATSALTESVSALTANDNIAFFNLIKDYGNSNEELARLYDDMDAANTAGKTVVALSNFATGDTTNAAVFATFRKDMNGGFYGDGSGVHYNGTTYIAARAIPIFRRDDYYNVIKKDGHFYFSDMGTIAPYTLPTAAANTKGGVKVGSGLTMNGEVMSVNIGEGLAFSGDTLVVSGGTGGGQVFYIDNIYENHQDLATLLFGYWDWNNGMISSAYPADDLHIYMWMGQDFQGAFDMPTKGYVELFPDSVYEEDGMYFMNLTGVYVHENTAYTFKYGLASNGDSRGNWTEPVFNFSFGNYISYCRFGNDGRGYLTYDADNDRFEYDSAYVTTGDTSNACPDLVDWLLTKQGLIDGGLVFDYICVQNLNKFFVVSGGATHTYTHPAIGFVELASPYTIGDYTFGYEITYKYSDWEMKIDVSEGNNVGANIRITAL